MPIRSSKLLDSQGRPIIYRDSDDANVTSNLWNTTRSLQYGATMETLGPLTICKFEYNQPFSLCIWYKSWSTSSYFHTLFSDCMGTATFQGYTFRINNTSGVLNFFLSNSYSSYKIEVFGSTNVRTGIWKFLSATYDGSGVAAGTKIYINGIEEIKASEIDTLGGRSIVPDVTVYPLCIGNNLSFGANNYSRGYLCEASVSNKELSADELLIMYGSGKPQDPRKFAESMQLIHHWRLADTTKHPITPPIIGADSLFNYNVPYTGLVLDAP